MTLCNILNAIYLVKCQHTHLYSSVNTKEEEKQTLRNREVPYKDLQNSHKLWLSFPVLAYIHFYAHKYTFKNESLKWQIYFQFHRVSNLVEEFSRKHN